MRSSQEWWNLCKVIRSIFLFSFMDYVSFFFCASVCICVDCNLFVNIHKGSNSLENTRRTRNIFHRNLDRTNAKWIYLHILFGTTLMPNTIIFHAKWNAHLDVTLNGSIRKWINGQLNWVVHFTVVLPLVLFFTTLHCYNHCKMYTRGGKKTKINVFRERTTTTKTSSDAISCHFRAH